jgi:hypothetical protein
MRSKNYRPRVQNGPVAKRQTRKRRSKRANRYHRQPYDRAERGSKVMWMMIFIGAALAAGFVFALRSQINAYKLGQAEEELRAALDEYSSQQKYLAVDQQRALSASESERAGIAAGLGQLELNQPSALPQLRQASLTTTQKASTASSQKLLARKASIKAPPKVSPQRSAVTTAQKASTQRKSIQAPQRNQPAKAKRGADNRRQTASRAQPRR